HLRPGPPHDLHPGRHRPRGRPLRLPGSREELGRPILGSPSILAARSRPTTTTRGPEMAQPPWQHGKGEGSPAGGPDGGEAIESGRRRWQAAYDAARAAGRVRDADFTTLSGSEVDPVY